jgi:peptidoglycan/LPS O-acetylase OafA/YrhL
MKKIKSHIGMRGFAAILVVFYHSSFLPNHLQFEDYTLIPQRSYLMVDLFFLLSGFIMRYVYGSEELSKNSYIQFIFKRIVRVYPLHLACLFGILVINVLLYWLYQSSGRMPEKFWIDPHSWRDFVTQLFLVHSFLSTEPGWNIPSWSISAELFSYFLFPVLALGLRRHALLATATFFIFVACYYIFTAFTTGSLDITHGSAPLRCLAGFTLGMLLQGHSHFVRHLSHHLLSTLQVISLGLIATFLATKVNDTLIILPFSVLVLTTAYDKGLMARAFSLKPLQFLGDISYSVYLTHVPVMTLLYPIFIYAAERVGLDQMTTRAIWLVIFVSAVLIISTGTYKWIENPARRRLTQIRAVKRIRDTHEGAEVSY